MKIQCDVCEKQEASVFCVADEAVLCDECDRRVHHANKLASKHQRFTLRHPSFENTPICDICQEKRAFLFCIEDRAILCRECDIPIHKANVHTRCHNRFLLTGVRMSASSATYPNPNPNPNPTPISTSSIELDSKNRNSDMSSYDHDMPNNHSYYSNTNTPKTTSSTTNYSQNYSYINEEGSTSTNTTPKYLMESIPGWRLEDLLDSSYAPNYKVCIN